jgi:hypothetical protein
MYQNGTAVLIENKFFYSVSYSFVFVKFFLFFLFYHSFVFASNIENDKLISFVPFLILSLC